MFINKDINDQCAYAINLTKNGRECTLFVDDHFPVIDGDIAYCSEKNGLLWVPLLNKAWAKLHGSYDASRIHFLHHAMRDLTGAPSMNWQID